MSKALESVIAAYEACDAVYNQAELALRHAMVTLSESVYAYNYVFKMSDDCVNVDTLDYKVYK